MRDVERSPIPRLFVSVKQLGSCLVTCGGLRVQHAANKGKEFSYQDSGNFFWYCSEILIKLQDVKDTTPVGFVPVSG